MQLFSKQCLYLILLGMATKQSSISWASSKQLIKLTKLMKIAMDLCTTIFDYYCWQLDKISGTSTEH